MTTSGVVSIAFPIDAGYFTRRNDAISLESLIVGTRPASLINGALSVTQGDLTLLYQK